MEDWCLVFGVHAETSKRLHPWVNVYNCVVYKPYHLIITSRGVSRNLVRGGGAPGGIVDVDDESTEDASAYPSGTFSINLLQKEAFWTTQKYFSFHNSLNFFNKNLFPTMIYTGQKFKSLLKMRAFPHRA